MKFTSKLNKLSLALLALASFSQLQAAPFTFDSGSTDVDGALAFSDTDCPVLGTVKTYDVGTSGVKHLSSIDIHANCIVKFTPTGNGESHQSNPVRLLVSGDVVIDGKLDLDGAPFQVGFNTFSAPGGIGGPGGYNGGNTGLSGLEAGVGFGPAGGVGGASGGNNAGENGNFTPSESNPRLQTLIGGSGGGGAFSTFQNVGSGGGGGGAILIASSGSISIDGIISTKGGAANSGTGAGSDGMIHLIANQISGTGEFHAKKTILESSTKNLSLAAFTGTRYDIGLQRLTLDIATIPTLSISAIGGVDTSTVNSISLGASGDTSVNVTSTGLPEGTEVTVVVSGTTRTNSKAASLLDASGNASVTVNVPGGVSMMVVYVSIPLTTVAAANLPDFNGEQISIAKLEASPGKKAELVFYTASGKAVPNGFVKNPWSVVSLKG